MSQRQRQLEETKAAGGLSPAQQLAGMMNEEDWLEAEMRILGNGGYFHDNGSIIVGMCSKCPDVGPIGYKCRQSSYGCRS